MKHILNNGCGYRTGPREGGYVKNVFSADATLQKSNYGRQYNFLPAGNTLDEALGIIANDDLHELEDEPLKDSQIMELLVESLDALVLKDLLTYYYYY